MRNFAKPGSERITRFCTLLFLLFILSASVHAQEDSAALAGPDSGATQEENGPSLNNMKKTGAALTEAVKEENRIRQEKLAREEFLGYVYMVLGFGLVIAVAWFSVAAANKKRAKADEEKRKFLESKITNQHAKPVHKTPHRRGHRR